MCQGELFGSLWRYSGDTADLTTLRRTNVGGEKKLTGRISYFQKRETEFVVDFLNIGGNAFDGEPVIGTPEIR